MTSHLTDEQFNSALLTEADETVTRHLVSCDECRANLEHVREVLTSIRSEAHARAERCPLFWREQRAAIAGQISAGRKVVTRPLAWAGSLAVFALAAAWMSHGPAPVSPSPQSSGASTNVSAPVDPDHALLVDIQRSVRRDVPLALEPATLLAQELHAAANRKSDR